MEKLSSDVPSGSEGTVTYQVAVPDTNEEGDNSTTDAKFIFILKIQTPSP
jgi:hypothetical protein